MHLNFNPNQTIQNHDQMIQRFRIMNERFSHSKEHSEADLVFIHNKVLNYFIFLDFKAIS